jgi:CRP-like cAMP-binding protein
LNGPSEGGRGRLYQEFGLTGGASCRGCGANGYGYQKIGAGARGDGGEEAGDDLIDPMSLFYSNFGCQSITLKEAIDSYLRSFKTLCPQVTAAELDYLASGLTVSDLKPRHFYLHANTIQKEIGFVFSGLLRAFYIDDKGDQISVNFARENQYVTHYPAFITQTPSKYYFQCIEPSLIVNLSYKHMQDCYNRFPTLDRYGRLIAEEALKVLHRRIESFLFENAETRYLDFIERNPDLFNRVSLSYLSSYLGIERQSLTRIRKRLMHI